MEKSIDSKTHTQNIRTHINIYLHANTYKHAHTHTSGRYYNEMSEQKWQRQQQNDSSPGEWKAQVKAQRVSK